MYATAHYILFAVYALLPVAAVALSTWRAVRRQDVTLSRTVTGTIAGGIVIGTALVITYALVVGGRLSLMEMLTAAYLATSLMMMLKLFDWMASWPLRRAIDGARSWSVRMYETGPSGSAISMPRRIRMAITSAALFRVTLLVLLGLPAALAAVLIYRPKVAPTEDPYQRIGARFQDVRFAATDGTRLTGWWIPTEGRVTSTQTIVVCHGIGAGASAELAATKRLLHAGYNVLLFDFRGHGRSEGHLISFGDLERRDVLGAVKWLRTERTTQSQRIVGLGLSTGGAALLAAAGDDSEDGRAIEAVAVYGTYDTLPGLFGSVASTRFVFPFDRLMSWIGLPVASAHVGVNLDDFAPARFAEMLWPRPLMVIHGQRDDVVPFERGQLLYQRAGEPKRRLWLPGIERKKTFESDGGVEAVLEFFNEARPVPWI